jgi:hypothetical protein
MKRNYRIEFLPRYGTTIGVIWRIEEREDTNKKEDAIGNIRAESKEEQEVWLKIIELMNLSAEESKSET